MEGLVLALVVGAFVHLADGSAPVPARYGQFQLFGKGEQLKTPHPGARMTNIEPLRTAEESAKT